MNKTLQIILGVVVLVIIIVLVVVFGGKKPLEGEIKIGFIAPLSGGAAVAGEAMRNAVELALEEINEKGIKKKKLSVIYEDGKCDSKEATTAAQKLINIDKVKIILGGECSSETLGAAPIAEANKVILFSAFSSSPDITEAGDYIFRTIMSDIHPDVIGPILPYLGKHKTVAVITENTGYSMGIRKGIKEQLLSYDVDIVADEIFTPGEKDFKTYLIKIKSVNPEALFINTATSGDTPGLIVKQAIESGLTTKLYGNFLLLGSEAIKIAGDLLEGAMAYDAPLLDENNPRAKTFMEKYRARYNEPYSFWAAGAKYDTVYIIADALKECGENADCIKDYLYNMDWYEGTIGKYKFDENGDVIGIKCVVKKIINGKAEVIK